MSGRLLGHCKVQATERYADFASDWLKESVVRIAESIAEDTLTAYPDLKIEALGEARGRTTEEDHAIVTPLVPARIRARSRRAVCTAQATVVPGRRE